jgi:DNA-binding NarL/FixJ family response regulator
VGLGLGRPQWAHKLGPLIAEGATNRSVAQQRPLARHTVKTHLRNAFAELASRLARDRGS